jgi:Carboxypeptidase regulatory-like domain
MILRIARSLFVVLVVGLGTRPALGQTSANGSLRGSVRDPQGAVLPGTTVTATSAAVPTPFTVISDGEGNYRLVDLPPADYQVTAEREGFARYVRPGIVVRAGLNLSVDVDMVLGARSETCR